MVNPGKNRTIWGKQERLDRGPICGFAIQYNFIVCQNAETCLLLFALSNNPLPHGSLNKVGTKLSHKCQHAYSTFLWLLLWQASPQGMSTGRTFNPFPAKPVTLVKLFSSKRSLKEMLKRPEIFIVRTLPLFQNVPKVGIYAVTQRSTSQNSIHAALCVLCHRPHVTP